VARAIAGQLGSSEGGMEPLSRELRRPSEDAAGAGGAAESRSRRVSGKSCGGSWRVGFLEVRNLIASLVTIRGGTNTVGASKNRDFFGRRLAGGFPVMALRRAASVEFGSGRAERRRHRTCGRVSRVAARVSGGAFAGAGWPWKPGRHPVRSWVGSAMRPWRRREALDGKSGQIDRWRAEKPGLSPASSGRHGWRKS